MRRRTTVLIVIIAVILAVVAIILIPAIFKTPSCSDGVQNQGEQGIDCGGPCPYLCTALQQAPTVLFTKPLVDNAGRTDVIAEIENKNVSAAAKNVRYSVTLYGADKLIVQKATGTLDLPPATKVPVYVPAVPSGKQRVTRAFLEIDPTSLAWYALPSDPRILPDVTDVVVGGASSTPRVTATLANPSVMALANVLAIVLVRDVHGDVITASKTVVQVVPARGEATAVFTWNAPFTESPGSIEVVPVVPLP